MSKSKKHIIGFLIILLIIMVAGGYSVRKFISQEDMSHGQSMPVITKTELSNGRILIILIDSLPADLAFSDNMPFLNSYRQRGSSGISEVVSFPLSIGGDYAIFEGIIASPLAFLNDFRSSTVMRDNLFKRLQKQGKRIVLFGPLIRSAYGRYTDLSAYEPRAFRFSEYLEEAQDVFRQAYSFLSVNRWDVAVVQFVSLDYIGHLETPLSQNYRKSLRIFDSYVKLLIGLVGDEDIVLITSEHGIDNRGFHTEEKPSIINTPFVLVGKSINRKANCRVLQVDWAPTISVLTGVSHFYNHSALPALHLIKISEEERASILSEYSWRIKGDLDDSTWEALVLERLNKMRDKIPEWIYFILIGTVLILAITLVSVALTKDSSIKVDSMKGRYILLAILATVLIANPYFFAITENLTQYAPFSANFMMAHPIGIIIFFSSLMIIGWLLKWKVEWWEFSVQDTIVLLLFIISFSGAFTAADPYHILNWIIFSIPVLGFAISGRSSWLVIFLSLWTGLAIRRLTYLNAYMPINLPPRWVLAAMMLVLATLLLRYHRRHNQEKLRSLLLQASTFIPSVLIIAFPIWVEWKAFMLIVLFLFCCLIIRDHVAWKMWSALWVTFFYLGTSGGLANTTHIVSFPILLVIWSIAEGSSSLVKGILISFVLWSFYFLPGNAFDLKIQELMDPYIMKSIRGDHISLTVLVFAARYIIPAAVLIWGVLGKNYKSIRTRIFVIAIIPILFGIGFSIMKNIINPTTGIPWQIIYSVTILGIYIIVLINAFLLSAIFSQWTKNSTCQKTRGQNA